MILAEPRLFLHFSSSSPTTTSPSLLLSEDDSELVDFGALAGTELGSAPGQGLDADASGAAGASADPTPTSSEDLARVTMPGLRRQDSEYEGLGQGQGLESGQGLGPGPGLGPGQGLGPGSDSALSLLGHDADHPSSALSRQPSSGDGDGSTSTGTATLDHPTTTPSQGGDATDVGALSPSALRASDGPDNGDGTGNDGNGERDPTSHMDQDKDTNLALSSASPTTLPPGSGASPGSGAGASPLALVPMKQPAGASPALSFADILRGKSAAAAAAAAGTVSGATDGTNSGSVNDFAHAGDDVNDFNGGTGGGTGGVAAIGNPSFSADNNNTASSFHLSSSDTGASPGSGAVMDPNHGTSIASAGGDHGASFGSGPSSTVESLSPTNTNTNTTAAAATVVTANSVTVVCPQAKRLCVTGEAGQALVMDVMTLTGSRSSHAHTHYHPITHTITHTYHPHSHIDTHLSSTHITHIHISTPTYHPHMTPTLSLTHSSTLTYRHIPSTHALILP